MTTRPTTTLRYARAKVTGPDGTEHDGQVVVTLEGLVTVTDRTDTSVVTEYGPGPIHKAGSRSWVVTTSEGPITIERAAGVCGTCGGKR